MIAVLIFEYCLIEMFFIVFHGAVREYVICTFYNHIEALTTLEIFVLLGFLFLEGCSGISVAVMASKLGL